VTRGRGRGERLGVLRSYPPGNWRRVPAQAGAKRRRAEVAQIREEMRLLTPEPAIESPRADPFADVRVLSVGARIYRAHPFYTISLANCISWRVLVRLW
jgi:hypothetical protein